MLMVKGQGHSLGFFKFVAARGNHMHALFPLFKKKENSLIFFDAHEIDMEMIAIWYWQKYKNPSHS